MKVLEITPPNTYPDCTCSLSQQIFTTGRDTCQTLYRLAQSQTDGRDDLLRAVLLFACSTIDSVGKQLAKDCLKELLDTDKAAQKTFEDFISRQIDKDARKILSRALATPDYRGELIKISQESIDGTSLQSYAQLSELTARFGVKTDDVIHRDDALKIFDIRQKIIHEMDIEVIVASGPTASRRQRAEDELIALSEIVLNAASRLIQSVHDKIHEPRAKI